LYVSHLTLHNFRSYAAADVALDPGVTAFIGRNGQGKTNLVEAIDYLSRLSSHRVATDAPLVRAGTDQAVVRAAVVKEGRTAVLEVELNPGRANRGRVNRAALPRVRDLVGLVRTVAFSPEDLSLVKGDPAERRRFLDRGRNPFFEHAEAEYFMCERDGDLVGLTTPVTFVPHLVPMARGLLCTVTATPNSAAASSRNAVFTRGSSSAAVAYASQRSKKGCSGSFVPFFLRFSRNREGRK
jgi:energy-coupling factor transporter ATP-binding protein EcfA2